MIELKDEALPQCKIKRNYSCNYCTYFTQNPRYHLTHLRDVHGEKIVINKCKLCLYASRHYQKLVRHMRMVHGCTDGISSSNSGGAGGGRGKRGLTREMRKRKLDATGNVHDSDTATNSINQGPNNNNNNNNINSNNNNNSTSNTGPLKSIAVHEFSSLEQVSGGEVYKK